MRLPHLLLIAVVVAGKAAHANETLQLWPYIENAAQQEQRERKVEGVSYLVGGSVAIALPFLTTSSNSTLRDVGVYTLVPAGVYSVLYGTYTVLTDSPWMKLKQQVERLSGPEENSSQWKLRREAHAREVLLARADSVRFWRYVWGGLEGATGLVILKESRSTPAIISSGLLLGLSAYHLFHKKAEERIVDQLERTTVGYAPQQGLFLAQKFEF